MLTFMMILLMVLAVILILAVLVQPGKGDMVSGMGSLGGGFTNMFGSRRTMDLLSKITSGFAAAIAILAIVTNLFFVKQDVQTAKPTIEGTSIPQAVPAQVPQQIPDLPQNNDQDQQQDNNEN